MTFETAFTMDTSSIKYGPGVTREVGYDMKELGAKRVMVVTDPNLSGSEPVSVTLEALSKEDIDTVLFDRVHVEPTDASLKEAIEFATAGGFDGYVAVGGGSSMDTAKAANLYATYPAEFLAYVNAPIGQGQPVPGRLKPLIAIPKSPPSLIDPPVQCRFCTRCPFATEICWSEDPPLLEVEPSHLAACHHLDRIDEIREKASQMEIWEAVDK